LEFRRVLFRSETFSLSSVLRICKMSSTIITVPPQLNGAYNSIIDISKQIDDDASTPESVARPNSSFAQYINSITLLCSITAAFGNPVDPDVKTRYATLLGSV